ncbi:MAG: PDDEXK nuclease domain-containing protein [Coriobacteriia bacterium]|nr:PDDEXK nuclease domain-containing protein [Coriobacteriia bacterium]
MSEKIETYRDAVVRIKNAVLQSRYRAASAANAEQLNLYFSVGGYISVNTRSGKWGSGAIEAISQQLQTELPGLRGFSPTSMKSMRLFYEEWSDVIRPLATDELPLGTNRQLLTADLESANGPTGPAIANAVESEDFAAFLRVGFTHHRQIIAKCKDLDERWYYIKRCAAEFWSVEALKSHMRARDYQHSGGLPNNFTLTLPDEHTAARAVRSFKDEYLLDFINIEDETDPELIDERVVSHEIVRNITKFIMSMGRGFTFVGENHRVIFDEQEYFIDILLYSRDLRCLVALELKSGGFKPSYLGQLSFYLSALDELEKMPDENGSIGLLLCKKASKSTVEFAVRDYNKPMGVAVYKAAEDVPEQYQSLKPLIDGVQGILSEENEVDSAAPSQ